MRDYKGPAYGWRTAHISPEARELVSVFLLFAQTRKRALRAGVGLTWERVYAKDRSLRSKEHYVLLVAEGRRRCLGLSRAGEERKVNGVNRARVGEARVLFLPTAGGVMRWSMSDR
ncbi:hypothetical protein CDV36_005595 [Fusarium kuroshium]|uniref:Uncharacterized protein n=1 Tax=Fusarium kuroshium TaxID=2010991 RepID=A0A3M2SBQ3_9HYPO|nr:hypothetical protein CDV36_005595 [Fusarium kuroshium]